MPLDYAGKTLRGRPFKPGEDLREANFSGANLQGLNFKGLDLSGANFSHADIRGANFTEAMLEGANFSHAKAGLQRRWVILLVIFSLILSVLSGFTSFIAGLFTVYFFLPETIKEYTIIPGIVFLIVLAAFFIVSVVTNTINELPASPKPDQPGLKELLTQLQAAIEAETHLSDDDKAEALEQVKALAEAGKNPKEGATQKAAKTASTMLKGIFAGLPAAAALVEAWNKLWPAIASLFSLA